MSGAVRQLNPHLHNVPLQIAAERGLPALAIWLWFVVDAAARFHPRSAGRRPCRRWPTAGLACVIAMLAAGMFEYNFGDSEFLMLFLARDHAAPTPPIARPPGREPPSRHDLMPMLPDLLDRLHGRSVLVIGDLMVDQFVIGNVDRISPEAPVPIVRFDHETWRLGGAANVAHNIVALGGRVEAVGVVGADAEATRLLGDCRPGRSAPPASSSDGSRCTTRKLRVVTTRNQQVARIDYENDVEIERPSKPRSWRKSSDLLADRCEAIVVSDYLKGVVSAGGGGGGERQPRRGTRRAAARRSEGTARRATTAAPRSSRRTITRRKR